MILIIIIIILKATYNPRICSLNTPTVQSPRSVYVALTQVPDRAVSQEVFFNNQLASDLEYLEDIAVLVPPSHVPRHGEIGHSSQTWTPSYARQPAVGIMETEY